MPFGQLPALECDGKVISQSLAIARFLARENGLAGKDNWEAAEADMIADCINDMFTSRRHSISILACEHVLSFTEVIQFLHEKDEERKKTLEETYHSEYLPNFLSKMEALLEANGGEFFVGKEVRISQSLKY